MELAQPTFKAKSWRPNSRLGRRQLPLRALALALYTASLPFQGFSVLNLGARAWGRIDWICGLILVVVVMLSGRLRHQAGSGSGAQRGFILCAFAALLGIVNFFDASSSQFVDFATSFTQLCFALLVFYAISALPPKTPFILLPLRVWYWTAFLVSIYGIYQFFARMYQWPFAAITLSNPVLAPGGHQTYRTMTIGFAQVSSVFREPTWLGAYLLYTLAFFGMLMVTSVPGYRVVGSRRLTWGILLVIFICFIMTYSLSSYISMFILLFIGLFSGTIRTPSAKLAVSLMIVISITLYVGSYLGIDLFSGLISRFRDLFADMAYRGSIYAPTSFGERFQRGIAGLRVWIGHPFVGVGMNNLRYHSDVAWTNSGWIQLLVDQGLLGFAVLVVNISVLASRIIRNIHRSSSPVSRSLSYASLYLLITCCLVNLSTFTWHDMLPWWALGQCNWFCIYADSISGKSAISPTPQLLRARRASSSRAVSAMPRAQL